MIAVLAMLCVQSVGAQDLTVTVWTNKPQYDPGEKGVLKISILNKEDEPYEIYDITIDYPWKVYDAEKGEWVGNETIKGDTRILATLTSKGGDYYKESEFTVPSDGRAIMGNTIHIKINRSDPDPDTPSRLQTATASLSVAAPSFPMSIVDLDTWMTSLTVVIVICTIILAIVVFLSTRRARAPRALALPPPPPPKAKAKAE